MSTFSLFTRFALYVPRQCAMSVSTSCGVMLVTAVSNPFLLISAYMSISIDTTSKTPSQSTSIESIHVRSSSSAIPAPCTCAMICANEVVASARVKKEERASGTNHAYTIRITSIPAANTGAHKSHSEHQQGCAGLTWSRRLP